MSAPPTHSRCCRRQVPDGTKVKIDKKTGSLLREGVPGILNPCDAHGLEAALTIKDKLKDVEVTALTMGPGQAVDMLWECLFMGAPRRGHHPEPGRVYPGRPGRPAEERRRRLARRDGGRLPFPRSLQRGRSREGARHQPQRGEGDEPPGHPCISPSLIDKSMSFKT